VRILGDQRLIRGDWGGFFFSPEKERKFHDQVHWGDVRWGEKLNSKSGDFQVWLEKKELEGWD